MLKRLRNNLGLKVLSVIAAVIIWAIVHNQRDPMVIKPVSVRVEVVHVPKDLAAVNVEPSQVTVTLLGRSSAFNGLEYAAFVLNANLTQGHVGTQRVFLTPFGLPPGLQIQHKERNTVTVELDPLATVSRPVYVEVRGRPAEGFAALGWQVRPNEASISGPSSIVQMVARIVAEVDISGRSTTLAATANLVARDTANLQVRDITISPPQATVSVPIRQVRSKTVPVVPIVSDLAPGYEIVSLSVAPLVVTLTGSGRGLAATNTIQTDPIDISGVQGGTRAYYVPLRVPDGLSVLGPASVRVTVTIRAGRRYTVGPTAGGQGASSGVSKPPPTTPPTGGAETQPSGQAPSETQPGSPQPPAGEQPSSSQQTKPGSAATTKPAAHPGATKPAAPKNHPSTRGKPSAGGG